MGFGVLNVRFEDFIVIDVFLIIGEGSEGLVVMVIFVCIVLILIYILIFLFFLVVLLFGFGDDSLCCFGGGLVL